MFNKLKNRIVRFMYGRYGNDNLNRFLLVVYIALVIVGMFLRGIAKTVVLALALVCALAIFFRMFSKNIYKRSAENRKFLALRAKIKNFFALRKSMWRDRKTHSYKKCPYCKAVLRLPKKRGEHRVDCPKCKREFKVKI